LELNMSVNRSVVPERPEAGDYAKFRPRLCAASRD
jgi:hypothetical protein